MLQLTNTLLGKPSKGPTLGFNDKVRIPGKLISNGYLYRHYD